jgi:hypothetical protein
LTVTCSASGTTLTTVAPVAMANPCPYSDPPVGTLGSPCVAGGGSLASGLSCALSCPVNFTEVGQAFQCQQGTLVGSATCIADCPLPASLPVGLLPGNCPIGGSLHGGAACMLASGIGYVAPSSLALFCSASGLTGLTALTVGSCTVQAPNHGVLAAPCTGNAANMASGASCGLTCSSGFQAVGVNVCQGGVLTVRRCAAWCIHRAWSTWRN